MHTDNRPYINSDGKADHANAQWRVDGIPEPYPMDGNYKILNTGSPLALSKSADSLLTANKYEGLANIISLTRQSNGSYLLKMAGSAIQTVGDKSVLAMRKTAGSAFYLDKQPDGTYLIRDTGGMYWRIEGVRKPIRVDGSATCPPDMCRPVLSGPEENRAPRNPDCDNPPPPQCKLATPFQLDWRWSP
jgi:hypothetical protein